MRLACATPHGSRVGAFTASSGSIGHLASAWFSCRLQSQTEHHLFPTVPFRYLPDITPIIQEVSEKHNVNFRKPYDGFLTVFKLYLDRIVYLSKPESEEKAPAAPPVVLEVEA